MKYFLRGIMTGVLLSAAVRSYWGDSSEKQDKAEDEPEDRSHIARSYSSSINH